MASFFVVFAGRGEAEDADVPVEIACVPAKDNRSESRVALGELGVADVEVERADGPAARTGEGWKSDADVDIHGDRARHDGDGVGPPQDLPRRHVAQRKERGRVVLIHVERDAPVEDRRVNAAVVMIGVTAKIEPGLRRQDPAENIGIALDPRAHAVFSGANLPHAAKGQRAPLRSINAVALRRDIGFPPTMSLKTYGISWPISIRLPVVEMIVSSRDADLSQWGMSPRAVGWLFDQISSRPACQAKLLASQTPANMRATH